MFSEFGCRKMCVPTFARAGMVIDKLSAQPSPKEKYFSKIRVLIADDDEKIIRFVSLNLRSAGYDVITASNGEIALKLWEAEKPDILVLDIIMPVVNGFEVLKKIRAASPVPVIICSARTSLREDVLRLGANDFLGKPFIPSELVNKVNRLSKRTT
jgi:two-component system, OmpR family, KDP operon response regulator KdpE